MVSVEGCFEAFSVLKGLTGTPTSFLLSAVAFLGFNSSVNHLGCQACFLGLVGFLGATSSTLAVILFVKLFTARFLSSVVVGRSELRALVPAANGVGGVEGFRDDEVDAVVLSQVSSSNVGVFCSVAGWEYGVEGLSYDMGGVGDQLFESEVTHTIQEVSCISVVGCIKVKVEVS